MPTQQRTPTQPRAAALAVEFATGLHIGDKAEQQDRLAVIQGGRGTLLAVLADGMGGMSGGALAADEVVRTATRLFEGGAGGGEAPECRLQEILEQAHAAIRRAHIAGERHPHSTAVALLLQRERADWVHSGDSRLYHFRGARLLSRTTDHSWVERLYREGKIAAHERPTHPQRNYLVSCLGTNAAPTVDAGSTAPLQAGDAFLLCSDGLWSWFNEAELGAMISMEPARPAADRLVAEARRRAQGNGDNVSLVIVKLVAGGN